MTRSRITDYLEEVERELPPGWPVRDMVLRDLRMHIEAAVEAGATEEEAMVRLGPPEGVAGTLLEDYEPTTAPLGHRVGAFILDTGVGWALLWSGLVLARLFSGWPTVGGMPWLIWAWVAVAAILAIVYFPAFEATLGRTPGKMLAGLHVVREDGHRIGWKEALLRRLPLFFEFFWLDALFAPFTERKQRAFDMVAGTVVVRGASEAGDQAPLAWVVGLLLWITPFVFVAVANNLI